MYAKQEIKTEKLNDCLVFGVTTDIFHAATESILSRAKQQGIILYSFARENYVISFTANSSNWKYLLNDNFINISCKVYLYKGIKQYTVRCELNTYEKLVENMLKKNSWFISQNFLIFPWIKDNKLIIKENNNKEIITEFLEGKKCNLRLLDKRSSITMEYKGQKFNVSRPVTDNIFSNVFIENDNVIIGILNTEALDFITRITKEKGEFCFELNNKILTVHQLKYNDVRKDICIMICKDRDEAQKILLQIKNPITSMKLEETMQKRQNWLINSEVSELWYIILIIICLLSLAGFYLINKYKLKSFFFILFFLFPHYIYLRFFNILVHILFHALTVYGLSLCKRNQSMIIQFASIIVYLLAGFYFGYNYNYELFALSRVLLFTNSIGLFITLL